MGATSWSSCSAFSLSDAGAAADVAGVAGGVAGGVAAGAGAGCPCASAGVVTKGAVKASMKITVGVLMVVPFITSEHQRDAAGPDACRLFSKETGQPHLRH